MLGIISVDYNTPIFSNNFFKLIEGSKYRKPIIATDSADSIVVLSGMLEINEVEDLTYIDWEDPVMINHKRKP